MVQRTRCSPAPCGGDAAGARGHFPSQRRQVVKRRRGDETPTKLPARAQLLGSVCELFASPRRRDAAGGVLEIRNSRSYRNACSFVGVAKTTRRRCSASHPAVESVPVGWDMRSWLLGNAFPLARKCVPTGWDMRSLASALAIAPHERERARAQTHTHTHTRVQEDVEADYCRISPWGVFLPRVSLRARVRCVCACVRALACTAGT